MKNKKSLIVGIIVGVVFLAIYIFVFFVPSLFSSNSSYNLSSYDEREDVITINSLHIDASVSKNNTIEVTESFSVTFNQSNLTEVVRLIPYITTTYRSTEDGGVSSSLLVARIYDVSGEGEFGETLNLYPDEVSGYLTIGLKTNRYIPLGETRDYVIRYTYDFGADKNRGFDDVYFNLVGTESLLTMYNISFTISLPGEVEEAKNIQMYVGQAGSTTSLAFESSGNLITGSIQKLGPLEGITFRAVYSDGYLSNRGAVVTWQSVTAVIIGALMIGVAVLCFIKYKQRKELVMPVELIAPEGLTPLRAQFFDSGKADSKGIIATIVYLANKGYLNINQTESDEIELIKNKDILDSENANVRAVFNALFKGNNKVSVSKLDHSFMLSSGAVCTSENIQGQTALYEPKAKKNKGIISSCIFAGMVLLTILLFMTTSAYFGFVPEAFTFKLILACLPLFVMACIMYAKDKWAYVVNIILTAFLLVILLMLYIKFGFSAVDNCYFLLVAFIFASIATIFMVGETKYSESGEGLKGRTLGFKKYIKMCEVSQIKAFAEENPNYYFDVLPFAYVFDLSDVWIKKFESIEIAVPEWATNAGSPLTDILVFNALFNSFTYKVNKVQSSLNASSIKGFTSSGKSSGGFTGFGGRGFGGGGFSGGGGGGGGFGAR